MCEQGEQITPSRLKIKRDAKIQTRRKNLEKPEGVFLQTPEGAELTEDSAMFVYGA